MKNIFQLIKKNILLVFIIIIVFGGTLFVAQAQYTINNPKPDSISAQKVENFFGGTTDIINRIGSFAIDTSLYMPSWISSATSDCINKTTLTDTNSTTGSESCLSISGTSRFSSLRVNIPAYFISSSGSKLVVGDYANGISLAGANDVFIVDDTLSSYESILVDGLKRLSFGVFSPRDLVSKTNICANVDGILFPCDASVAVTYAWDTGAWSACLSNSQTRTVVCQDDSGNTVDDSFCTTTKPATSQTCDSSVNGSCGSSNGDYLSSAPSTGLCSVGTASSVSTTTTSYTRYQWTCDGSDGGTNDSCTAYKGYTYSCQSDGSWLKGLTCTPRDYTSTATYSEGDSVCYLLTPGATCASTATATNGLCDNTTNNSCTTGTLSDTTDSSTNYLWSCLGANGGTDDSCSLAKVYSCTGTYDVGVKINWNGDDYNWDSFTSYYSTNTGDDSTPSVNIGASVIGLLYNSWPDYSCYRIYRGGDGKWKYQTYLSDYDQFGSWCLWNSQSDTSEYSLTNTPNPTGASYRYESNYCSEATDQAGDPLDETLCTSQEYDGCSWTLN